MLVFFSKKVISLFATLFVLASLTFLLMHVVPGGPFDTEKALPPMVKANIAAKFGLDLPLYQQYGKYIVGMLHGDFGPSYKYLGRTVRDVILESLPTSLQLGFLSLGLAVVLGIGLGILAAYKQNSWIDFSTTFLAVAGMSLPSYFIAAILIYVFCVRLDFFPPALWEDWRSMVLPVITLGTRPAALIARLTRASLLETLRADYIRTARAKGVSEHNVLWKHGLRNSILPVVSLLGPLTANIVTGTFVVEYVFAIPGMGKYFIDAVTNRDYPLIMGVTMVYGLTLVLCNMLVDIAYAVIDPRIRVR